MITEELPLIADELIGPAAAPPPMFAGKPTSPAAMSIRPGNSREALRAWLIDDLLIPAFRPRTSTEPPWEWADRLGIPVEGGGKFSSRRKPHCRTFIGKTVDHRIREQHVMKASRAGFTQGVLVRITHKTKHDPGNVQFTAGSKENSKAVNTGRLIPALAHIKVIGRPDDDPDDATSSLIRIGGYTIRITGAFTAGAYRTHMVDLCVNDDCEVVQDIPGIGSPADGGRSRIRGREGAQLLSISRPTTWGTPHHRDVATGTLEYYAVPCPHCGTFQELTIDGRSLVDQLRIEDGLREGAAPLNSPLQHRSPRLGRLRFDHCKLLPGIDGTANPNGWDFNRILTETYYECVGGAEFDEQGNVTRHCRIDEASPLTADDLANPLCSFTDEVRRLHAEGYRLTHKQAMMLSGRHIVSNPHPVPADGGGPRSKRSEHNSDLVSLDFDMTWGHLAKKFAERAHDPASLRNFLNEHAGLPSRPGVAGLDDKDLIQCRASYERGTLPFVPDFVTLCGDTQDVWWKIVIVAGRLSSDGKAWRDIAVIDWGIATLKTDVLAMFEKPLRLAADPSQEFTPQYGLIDGGGHRTDEVYELHYESMQRLFPSYGRDDKTAQLRPTWQRPITEAWRGCTFDICWYWDDFWQRRIVSCVQQVRDIKHCIDVEGLDPSAKGLPARLWTPGIPGDAQLRAFEKELMNEYFDPEESRWKKSGTQDYRDALKQCFASLDLALPAVSARRAARRATSAAAPPAAL